MLRLRGESRFAPLTVPLSMTTQISVMLSAAGRTEGAPRGSRRASAARSHIDRGGPGQEGSRAGQAHHHGGSADEGAGRSPTLVTGNDARNARGEATRLEKPGPSSAIWNSKSVPIVIIVMCPEQGHVASQAG